MSLVHAVREAVQVVVEQARVDVEGNRRGRVPEPPRLVDVGHPGTQIGLDRLPLRYRRLRVRLPINLVLPILDGLPGVLLLALKRVCLIRRSDGESSA